jgi:hypothetical protein
MPKDGLNMFQDNRTLSKIETTYYAKSSQTVARDNIFSTTPYGAAINSTMKSYRGLEQHCSCGNRQTRFLIVIYIHILELCAKHLDLVISINFENSRNTIIVKFVPDLGA